MPFHYHSWPRPGNRAKKVKQKHRLRHIDHDWIYSKIGGHGGSYGWDHIYGRAWIAHIGSRSKLKIAWYNLILYLKWLNRRIKNDRDYT